MYTGLNSDKSAMRVKVYRNGMLLANFTNGGQNKHFLLTFFTRYQCAISDGLVRCRRAVNKY